MVSIQDIFFKNFYSDNQDLLTNLNVDFIKILLSLANFLKKIKNNFAVIFRILIKLQGGLNTFF